MLEVSEDNSDVAVSKSGIPPTDAEMEQLFNNLCLSDTKQAVLSLILPHSDTYVPKLSLSSFPQPMTSLRSPANCKLNYPDLLKACDNVCINDIAQAVEKETRKQSRTALWFKFRAGRVTASCMKAICHTDVTTQHRTR